VVLTSETQLPKGFRAIFEFASGLPKTAVILESGVFFRMPQPSIKQLAQL
jgi:hypothetical protein